MTGKEPVDKKRGWAAFGMAFKAILVAVIGAGGGYLGSVLQHRLDTQKLKLEEMKFAYEIIKTAGGERSLKYQEWACEILNSRGDPSATLNCVEAAEQVIENGANSIPGDPNKTYVSVFHCQSDEPVSRATLQIYHQVVATLADGSWGVIRLRRGWVDSDTDRYARDLISGGAVIVTDAGHREEVDAERLSNALSPMPTRIVANTGTASPWSLAVIVCGAS